MRVKTLLAAVGMSVLLGGTSLAALPSGGAYVDGGGFTWAGMTLLENVSDGLKAEIYWCVYDINSYPGTGGYSPATGPYGTGEFAYAYEIISLGTAPVTQLSVNMIESNEANDIGIDATLVSGVSPFDWFFGNPPPSLQTANWLFMDLTTSSDALVYSSVNEPTWEDGKIVNEGKKAVGPLPSPSDVIPEPATIALLGLGAAVLLRRRR